jgi:hypothetical protein
MAIGALYSNFIAAHSPKPKLQKYGWTKPLQNFIKLNVDASLDVDGARGTTVAVIRDSYGNFITTSNSKLGFVYDVMSAEVHAMKQGLILAQQLDAIVLYVVLTISLWSKQ